MLISRLFDLPIPISLPAFRYLSASVTRPADTSAYAANDAFADNTSTPTAGGFAFTQNTVERVPNVGAAVQPVGGNLSIPFSGGGLINDMIVVASASTAYLGEIWLFERGVTAINDNAAFAISDAEALTLIGIIPFNTTDTTSNNAVSYVSAGGIGFACDPGSIRFLVKIMNAPTPASAEVLSFRLKYQPLRGI